MASWLLTMKQWEDWFKPTILNLIKKHQKLAFHQLKYYLGEVSDQNLQGGINCLMDINKIRQFIDVDGIIKYELIPTEDKNGKSHL